MQLSKQPEAMRKTDGESFKSPDLSETRRIATACTNPLAPPPVTEACGIWLVVFVIILGNTSILGDTNVHVSHLFNIIAFQSLQLIISSDVFHSTKQPVPIATFQTFPVLIIALPQSPLPSLSIRAVHTN